jgi:hypothetical protein
MSRSWPIPRRARWATSPVWRSRKTSAPSSRRSASRWALAEATTRAPRPRASCTSRLPTPPAAPWTSSHSPGLGSSRSSSCTAVAQVAAGRPARIQRDLLGIGAPAGAAHREQTPHRITGRPACSAIADRLDAPGQLVADHIGRAHPGPARVGPVAGVDRVHPDRLDGDHDLAGTGRGAGSWRRRMASGPPGWSTTSARITLDSGIRRLGGARPPACRPWRTSPLLRACPIR